jgi:hypothetical protein
MEIRGKCIVPGIVIGNSVVSLEPISFLGDIDPNTGNIIAEGHPLNGLSIAGKVFSFPFGKGSTVGSYVIYQLFKNGKAPAAIINKEAETIVAVGAIISGIPMIHRIDINVIPHGVKLEVNATKGIVKYKEHLKI